MALRQTGSTETQLHSFLALALDEAERLNLGSSRLTPSRGPRYRLNARLFGIQSRAGRFGEGKYLYSLPEFDPRMLQHSPVAIKFASAFPKNLFFAREPLLASKSTTDLQIPV
jgi:hypothetical protein